MGEGGEIRAWLSFLRRRLAWILIFLVAPPALAIVAALYYLGVAPRIFSATAIMEVPAEAQRVTGIEDAEHWDSRGEEFLKTIEQSLQRISLYRRVLAREDIRKDEGLRASLEEPLENFSSIRLAEEVHNWIRVRHQRNTRLILVSVENRNPETAARIANAVVEEFIGESMEAQSGSSESAFEFLLKEGEKIRERLQKSEDRLTSFRGFEEAILIKAKIEKQNDTLLELSQRYREKHPKVLQARSGLAALEKQLETELAQARVLLGEEESGSAADSGAELMLLEARYNVLAKEVEADRALYETIVGRMKETDITRELKTVPVRFVERAFVPSEPIRPQKLQVLAFALVLGGGVGVGLVWLLAMVDKYARLLRDAGEKSPQSA